MGVQHRCEIKRHPPTKDGECQLCKGDESDLFTLFVFVLLLPILVLCLLIRNGS